MNILIPHSWLLEHLETDATPQKIQELVSLSGPSIERIYEHGDDCVYDIEVTTNRVDSMSVRGIAREAAVILNQAGIPAKLKPLQIPELDLLNKSKNLPLPAIHNDAVLSKRILAIILTNVEHTPTPDWMAIRLQEIGQNVHDSIIDITNYITHELGHPCHAFDYDKIFRLAPNIRVVSAQKNKKFITLDDIEYNTIGGEVVFENDAGEIIDFPGIKGTKNTAIDHNTQNVLFWIESIQPDKVRFGSMSHAIRTVAAQLNEKNVDPHLADAVLARGVELYQTLCQAQVASAVYDEFPSKAEERTVTMPLSMVQRYLGIELEPIKVQSLLEQLEFKVQYDPNSTIFTVIPPTFRPDIEMGADIIEEIARIYGYHNLPSTLMPTAIPTTRPTHTNFAVEEKIKTFLADIGWQEVYTYSLVSEAIALKSGYAAEQHLKLQNPLTDDRIYLRRTLIYSLAEVLDMNPERPELSVFELANVYHPQKTGPPKEVLHMTLVSQKSYRAVRGDLEALLRQLYVTRVRVTPEEKAEFGALQQAQITATNKKGQVKRIGTILILTNNRVTVDLILGELLDVVQTHPTYQPLPKAAPLKEDLTFVLPEKTAIGTVMESIASMSSLIVDVTLADQYKQNYTFTITYSDQEKSLSSQEVEPIRKEIVSMITKNFTGNLVGSLT